MDFTASLTCIFFVGKADGGGEGLGNKNNVWIVNVICGERPSQRGKLCNVLCRWSDTGFDWSPQGICSIARSPRLQMCVPSSHTLCLRLCDLHRPRGAQLLCRFLDQNVVFNVVGTWSINYTGPDHPAFLKKYNKNPKGHKPNWQLFQYMIPPCWGIRLVFSTDSVWVPRTRRNGVPSSTFQLPFFFPSLILSLVIFISPCPLPGLHRKTTSRGVIERDISILGQKDAV